MKAGFASTLRSQQFGALCAATAMTVMVPLVALAQVDCSNPDNLCTGDPCVVGSVEVMSPCVVDFGARTLVLDGNLSVPSAGVLDLTADTINVEAKIKGAHAKPDAGDGAHVSLSANGVLNQRGKIDVSGRFSPGSISLTAGGDLNLSKLLQGKSRGGAATASGATVLLQAGGAVNAAKSAKIKVKGKKSTDGGQVLIVATSGVTYDGKIDVRGLNAGTVSVTCSAGDIAMAGDLRGDAFVGSGGNAIFNASGDVAIEDVDMSGPTTGGAVGISGSSVSSLATADVDGNEPGFIYVTSQGDVTVGRLTATGRTLGGTIGISALGFVDVQKVLRARASVGSGGDIQVIGEGGVSIRDIVATGRQDGGSVLIEAGTALSPLSGATLDLVGDVHLGASTGTGGEFRATCFGGDATVGTTHSQFDVDGPSGGVFEVIAFGNLTASGDFVAESGGCIALAAGGTLDTTQATFDVPPSISCP